MLKSFVFSFSSMNESILGELQDLLFQSLSYAENHGVGRAILF